jgi:uncharacterized protein HemY
MARDEYFLFKANEFFEKAKSEANREKRIAFENVAQGYLRMAEQAIRKKEPAAERRILDALKAARTH